MSNDKDYSGFFHKLHCILRDGEIGLTGLNALNEINNMIFILFMEQYVDEYEISTKMGKYRTNSKHKESAERIYEYMWTYLLKNLGNEYGNRLTDKSTKVINISP